jgi:hypothetical protein
MELRFGNTNTMPFYQFQWTDDLIEHIGEHGISVDDFESVVCNPYSRGYSRSSQLPAAWGYTADGRYIMAVYEELDELTLLPVTAYEVSEPA